MKAGPGAPLFLWKFSIFADATEFFQNTISVRLFLCVSVFLFLCRAV